MGDLSQCHSACTLHPLSVSQATSPFVNVSLWSERALVFVHCGPCKFPSPRGLGAPTLRGGSRDWCPRLGVQEGLEGPVF